MTISANVLLEAAVERANGIAQRAPSYQGEGESEPWLHIVFRPAIPAGKWISIRYQTSFFDELKRPLIRFRRLGKFTDVPLPAALFGSGQWIGRVPPYTDLVALSPGGRRRHCGFVIEDCRELTRIDLTKRAVEADFLRAFTTTIAICLAQPEVALERLAMDASHHSLDRYHQWRLKRMRSVDLAGIDKPRHDWSQGIHVLYICDARSAANSAVSITIQSLRRQVYPHWSLALVSDGPFEYAREANRVLSVAPDATATALRNGTPRPIYFAPIVAGSLVPEYATAVLAEYIAAHPQQWLIYADEDEVDQRGRYMNPKLKPDWSPEFQRCAQYVGDALFVRDNIVKGLNITASELVAPPFAESLFRRPVMEVGHIRRILLTRSSSTAQNTSLEQSCSSSAGKRHYSTGSSSDVSIIIPTKDRAHLLEACIDRIKRAKHANIDVVLVDNGSKERRTKKLYARISGDSRFQIKYAPGPFNFAQLCNDGASAARSHALLFLNNDVEPLNDDWLSLILPWVRQESIGAVGAKLLYPSGRLQHGGIVLGLRGNAGHVDIGREGDAAGYLQRLAVPHEVMAVTGACLAVDRGKFEAVGGFDAEHFPVELNDIDLCLRLRAKNWQSLIVPSCRLIHHESATRGRAKRPQDRYPREHQAFRQRWGEAIYEDPYFHPALALTSTSVALG